MTVIQVSRRKLYNFARVRKVGESFRKYVFEHAGISIGYCHTLKDHYTCYIMDEKKAAIFLLRQL